MVERQIVARPAILAFKLVAQKKVKPRESGIFRWLHILAQRDDGRNLHIQAGAVDMLIIIGNDIDLVEEHRFDCGLPRPQAQWIIA